MELSKNVSVKLKYMTDDSTGKRLFPFALNVLALTNTSVSEIGMIQPDEKPGT